MQLSIDAKTFRKALGTVMSVVHEKAFIPAIACVRLSVEDGVLHLAGTCLDQSITTSVEARCQSGGVVCVPGHLLTAIVGALPDGDMTLEQIETRLAVSAGSHTSSLATILATDFPSLPEWPGPAVSLDAKVLSVALGAVLYATTKDKVRPALAGVFFDVKPGSLCLAAADGFNLAVRKIETSYDGEPFGVVVPGGKTLKELAGLLSRSEGNVEIALTAKATQIMIHCGETTIASRLIIEGTFPSYWQLIPTSHNTRLSMSVATMAAVVSRVEQIARHSDCRLYLHLKPGESSGGGEVEVSATAANVGEARELCWGSVEGEEIKLCINAEHMLETLAALPRDGAFFLDTSSPDRPFVFRPAGSENAIHITMPMYMK